MQRREVWLANCYFAHDSSGFLPPCYDSAMRNLLERLCHDQALHDSSHACKLLIVKEMVGASGFEPGPEPVDKIR